MPVFIFSQPENQKISALHLALFNGISENNRESPAIKVILRLSPKFYCFPGKKALEGMKLCLQLCLTCVIDS